jgi:hypothetical protein
VKNLSAEMPKPLRTIFGAPLEGDASVRFIYVDEAGTAEHEPVTVVVGIILHADTQWMDTARTILQTFQKVPAKFRENFISHATAIWGSEKYRPEWSREDRLSFLYELMAIPLNLKLAVAYAAVSRKQPPLTVNPEAHYSKAQIDHISAFGICMGLADQYIRDQCAANELATVVAEDLPEMRKNLRGIMHAIQRTPFVIGNGPPIRITRVVDSVHYAAKSEAIVLQVADACAFGLRRYLSNQSMGEEFVRVMTSGKHIPVKHGDDLALSAGIFSAVTTIAPLPRS